MLSFLSNVYVKGLKKEQKGLSKLAHVINREVVTKVRVLRLVT